MGISGGMMSTYMMTSSINPSSGYSKNMMIDSTRFHDQIERDADAELDIESDMVEALQTIETHPIVGAISVNQTDASLRSRSTHQGSNYKRLHESV